MKKGDLFQRHAEPRGCFSGSGVPPGAVSGGRVSAHQLKSCSSKEARKLLSYELAERFQVLPLGLVRMGVAELLLVAAQEGHDPALLKDIQFATGRRVRLAGVDRGALAEAIFLAYHDDDSKLAHTVAGLRTGREEATASLQQSPEFRGVSGDAAQLIEALVDYAIAKQASDIHLLARHDGSYVKLRIHGELYSHAEALGSLGLHQQIISRIKVLAGLDITCRNLPQDGSFKVPMGTGSVHIRASLMPTVHGEKAVLRLAGSRSHATLDSLEFPPEVRQQLEQTLELHEGALFFAGPTGSGKTTTMYALMVELASRNLNVVSVEDPVEFHLNGITQTEVRVAQGLDYPTCLRSILRQDPNVVMLGEIRDEESARVALQAALSGHLIVSTVHARSALEVFMRLQSLGIDAVTLSHAVRLAISQRLLPRLCEQCKIFDLAPSRELDLQIFRQVGCSRCDYTGYSGRVMAVDSLLVDSDLAREIQKGRFDPQEVIGGAGREPQFTFEQSIRKLLAAGKISYQHARPWVRADSATLFKSH